MQSALQDKPPASFILKLCTILKSKDLTNIIYWDEQLRGIRIVNQKMMSGTVLPKYFRHHKFSSFVRQLNMYNFHKVHLPDHKSIFCHSQFDPSKYNFDYIRKQSWRVVRRKVSFIDPKTKSSESVSKVSDQNLTVKQSFKMFFKNSIISGILGTQLGLNKTQALEGVFQEVVELPKQKQTIRIKLLSLRKSKKYRRFVRDKQFVRQIYTRLGIQDDFDDNLSELSIEEQLIGTKKSLQLNSLKLLQSGPLLFKDTIGRLLG